MTVKEFLQQVRDEHFKLRSLRRLRAQRRRDIMDLKGQSYEHDKITGTKDSSLDDTVARLIERTKDYDDQIRDEITQLALFRREAIKMIEEIKDENEEVKNEGIQSIFMDRYLCHMSWTDITQERFEKLHYKNDFMSLKRMIFRQHGEGLRQLSEKYPDCSVIFKNCVEKKEEITKNARAEAPAFRHGEEARAPLILKQLNM